MPLLCIQNVNKEWAKYV